MRSASQADPTASRQTLKKSALTSPTPGELARLTGKAGAFQPEPGAASVNEAPTRSLRRKLPLEVIDEVVQRYKTGEFTTDLSREYGISKNGLLKLLRAERVSLRKQPISLGDAKRAVQLYESGLTIEKVVEQIGYSYGTIRKTLHENGVAMRATCIRKRAVPDERS